MRLLLVVRKEEHRERGRSLQPGQCDYRGFLLVDWTEVMRLMVHIPGSYQTGGLLHRSSLCLSSDEIMLAPPREARPLAMGMVLAFMLRMNHGESLCVHLSKKQPFLLLNTPAAC